MGLNFTTVAQRTSCSILRSMHGFCFKQIVITFRLVADLRFSIYYVLAYVCDNELVERAFLFDSTCYSHPHINNNTL